MAERRMMAKSVIDTDTFLDMPASTQSLYFHMLLRADDDGFIASPKGILRIIGASDDDLKLLLAKQYLFRFESGVVVIKDWKIHNYIKSDRYKPSMHPERELLTITANKEYSLINSDKAKMEPGCIQNGYKMEPECIQNGTIGKVRLGKVRLGKASIGKVRLDKNNNEECEKSHSKRKRFKPPTLEEVEEYCKERNNGIDAQYFIDYYEARGWELSKGRKVKSWKHCINTWEKNNYNQTAKRSKQDALNDMRDLMSEYGGVNEQSNEPSTEDTGSTIDIEYRVEH